MKKKMFVCGLSALIIGMVSCKSQQKDTKSVDTEVVATVDYSHNVLNWDGFYSGVLPCADCSGIQVSLELSKDLTYILNLTYIGKDDNSFDSSGKFAWNKERNRITLGESEDEMQFLVG